MAPPKTADKPRGTILGSIQNGLVTFSIRAVPLPQEILTFLVANGPTIKRLQRDRRAGKADDDADDVPVDETDAEKPVAPEEFWPRLEELCKWPQC